MISKDMSFQQLLLGKVFSDVPEYSSSSDFTESNRSRGENETPKQNSSSSSITRQMSKFKQQSLQKQAQKTAAADFQKKRISKQSTQQIDAIDRQDLANNMDSPPSSASGYHKAYNNLVKHKHNSSTGNPAIQGGNSTCDTTILQKNAVLASSQVNPLIRQTTSYKDEISTTDAESTRKDERLGFMGKRFSQDNYASMEQVAILEKEIERLKQIVKIKDQNEMKVPDLDVKAFNIKIEPTDIMIGEQDYAIQKRPGTTCGLKRSYLNNSQIIQQVPGNLEFHSGSAQNLVQQRNFNMTQQKGSFKKGKDSQTSQSFKNKQSSFALSCPISPSNNSGDKNKLGNLQSNMQKVIKKLRPTSSTSHGSFLRPKSGFISKRKFSRGAIIQPVSNPIVIQYDPSQQRREFFLNDQKIELQETHYQPMFIAKDIEELRNNPNIRKVLKQYKIFTGVCQFDKSTSINQFPSIQKAAIAPGKDQIDQTNLNYQQMPMSKRSSGDVRIHLPRELSNKDLSIVDYHHPTQSSIVTPTSPQNMTMNFGTFLKIPQQAVMKEDSPKHTGSPLLTMKVAPQQSPSQNKIYKQHGNSPNINGLKTGIVNKNQSQPRKSLNQIPSQHQKLVGSSVPKKSNTRGRKDLPIIKIQRSNSNAFLENFQESALQSQSTLPNKQGRRESELLSVNQIHNLKSHRRESHETNRRSSSKQRLSLTSVLTPSFAKIAMNDTPSAKNSEFSFAINDMFSDGSHSSKHNFSEDKSRPGNHAAIQGNHSSSHQGSHQNIERQGYLRKKYQSKNRTNLNKEKNFQQKQCNPAQKDHQNQSNDVERIDILLKNPRDRTRYNNNMIVQSLNENQKQYKFEMAQRLEASAYLKDKVVTIHTQQNDKNVEIQQMK